MSEQVERGMMVFKVKTDKESIKTLVYQTCMLTTQCTKDNIKIIDCVITFGGGKSVIAEIKRVKARKDKADSELYIFYDTSGKELYRGRNREGLEKNIKEFFKEMHMQKELDNFERNEYFYSLNNGAFISEKVLNSRNYCVVKHIDIV